MASTATAHLTRLYRALYTVIRQIPRGRVATYGQIAAAVRVIVQLQRLADGSRRVTSVAEITGMEGDIVQMQEIFKFQRVSTDENGKIHGHFMATCIRPRFLQDLIAHGVTMPGSM